MPIGLPTEGGHEEFFEHETDYTLPRAKWKLEGLKNFFSNFWMLFLLSAVLLGIGTSVFALANKDYGLTETAKGVFGDTITDMPHGTVYVVGLVLKTLLSYVGVIFFILILHAGFKWMTAMGVSDKVERAQKILYHSTIGLIIVLSAYALTYYVVNSIGKSVGLVPVK